MIINAGIQKVVFEGGYADALAEEMLKASRIKVEKFNRYPRSTYDKRKR
jgi:deoxycytidylate deaminase